MTIRDYIEFAEATFASLDSKWVAIVIWEFADGSFAESTRHRSSSAAAKAEREQNGPGFGSSTINCHNLPHNGPAHGKPLAVRAFACYR